MQKYMQSGSRYHFNSGNNRKWTIIVLAIVMFALGFLVSKVTVGGGLESGKFQKILYQEIRNEAKNAVSFVNKLSRNNGTSSDYVTLSEIKSCIGSLESLNSISISIHGESGRIFTADELNNVNEIVDLYYSNLTTGSRVTENQMLLSEAVNSIYERTLQLAGD